MRVQKCLRLHHMAALGGLVLGTLIVVMLSRPLGVHAQADAPADTVIVNAKVYTADGKGTLQEALAIRGNKIAAVGSAKEVERLKGPNTQVIDARGSAVLPGFNDNHVHIQGGGLYYNQDALNITLVRKVPEIQERIRAFAKAHPNDPWIIGHGFYPTDFPDGYPTKELLDAAVLDRPAYIRAEVGHMGWANSKALAAAHITKGTMDPRPNGVVVKDPKTGEPTGYLIEAATSIITRLTMPQPTAEDYRRAMKWAMDEAHKVGVTSFVEIEGPDPPFAEGSPEGFMRWDELRRAGELTVRVDYAMGGDYPFSEELVDRWDAFWKQHPDTPELKTGIVKIYGDGVRESNLLYLTPQGNPPSFGYSDWVGDSFYRLVRRLDRSGWQMMIHGIGEGAVRMELDTYERVFKENPVPTRGRRHRIEHAYSLDPADAPRFGKLGVILSTQPGGSFVPTPPGGVVTPAPAPSPAPTVIRAPRKTIVDAGGQIVLGSDCCYFPPFAPMERIYSLAYAPPRPGQPDERLPLNYLLDAYTRGSAYAAFWDNQQGTLVPGKLADIVILATDIFSRPATRPEDIAVSMTIFDGKIVYRAAPAKTGAQTGRP